MQPLFPHEKPVPALAQRRIDPLWDALTALFGPARTHTEQTRRGKAARELKAAGATVEEVETTHRYCKQKFSNFTELALLSHLSAATRVKPVPIALPDMLAARRASR